MSRYSSPRVAIDEADLFIIFARVADLRIMQNQFMKSTISCDKTSSCTIISDSIPNN